MDVEGGFDKIDMDLKADFLVARDCPIVIVHWVRVWAAQHTVTFWFNSRISKECHLSRGIPQGSLLSPFVFGVYVADIFRPRLQYSRSITSLTVSYVDDGVITMAGDTRGMVKGRLEESFVECRIVAVGHGMPFSKLKTEWIGFGDGDWGSCRLDHDGADVFFIDDLQILGFRFGRDGSMDNHVKYWTQRGLEVRGRIGAIA